MQAIRLFCDVAELRSISQAAQRHGITQSAVSQRVRQLEERLGVELLDRSVRPFALTTSGQLLAREGRDLVARHDDLLGRVTQLDTSLIGRVRVMAIYSAGIGLLERCKQSFVELNPQVQVELEYGRPEAVEQTIREGRSDLGIVSYPKPSANICVKPLRDEPMAVVFRVDHPLASQAKVVPTDLDPYQLAGFDPALPLARHLRRYLRTEGAHPHITHVVDNIDTIKAMLAETENVSVLPLRTVAREVEAGSLAFAELEPPLARPMGILHQRRPPLSAVAAAFIEQLQHQVAEHGDQSDVPRGTPSKANSATAPTAVGPRPRAGETAA